MYDGHVDKKKKTTQEKNTITLLLKEFEDFWGLEGNGSDIGLQIF